MNAAKPGRPTTRSVALSASAAAPWPASCEPRGSIAWPTSNRPRRCGRFEYEAPGGLLHLDIKKLGRFHRPGHGVTGNRQQESCGAGWEYVHVGIDDHSRFGFSVLFPDETGRSACAFLLRLVRYYRGLGIRFQRVLADNGPCYHSRRFARLCRRLRLKHRRTKPYTPRRNGKAERFIQTVLREWAYARAYQSSDQRAAALPSWLHAYN